MTDIVERLRHWSHGLTYDPAAGLMHEAAAEIERLRTPTTNTTPSEGSVPGEGTVGQRLVERLSITHMLLGDNEMLRTEIARLREAIRCSSTASRRRQRELSQSASEP